MQSPSPKLLRALRVYLLSGRLWPSFPAQRALILHGVKLSSQTCTGPRQFSSITSLGRNVTTRPPKSHDRGPRSHEDTQTDFGAMNILENMKPPVTSIDACVSDGFHLNNGIKTSGGGIILVGGEAFSWRPSGVTVTRKRPALDIGGSDGPSWSLLELLWPKPDLLILGTGGSLWPLGKETRESIYEMGIKIDVMDTGNASAAYNLLATERGTDTVAAAMLPMGWTGGSDRDAVEWKN